ncbi:hypothetical protein BKA62DRAFT_783019 [Auriculariales sp. MPI-PUGE-AT-0066]|nr:hypothetical protein BKA62DRAFT_783019 [Auriculariales sp. MPI-PUGE-AT-0066]
MSQPDPQPATILLLPAPSTLTSLVLDDGTLRTYKLPDTKVKKAVRGLGCEVSSIAFPPSDSSLIYVAAGQHIFCLNLNTKSLSFPRTDAKLAKRVLTDEEDVLNESHLPAIRAALESLTLPLKWFASSDLNTIMWRARFPSSQTVLAKARSTAEDLFVDMLTNPYLPVVSGGYDCRFQHSDVHLGSYLSSYSLSDSPIPTQNTTSMSPPFVHCMCISAEGVLAAGLADGRVWLGFGGAKTNESGAKTQKKSKKWDGLDAARACSFVAATGPVVGLAFRDSQHLVTVSLGGSVRLVPLSSWEEVAAADEDPQSQAEITNALWQASTSKIARVNACNVGAAGLVVVGLTSDGKGAVEIWDPASYQLASHP